MSLERNGYEIPAPIAPVVKFFAEITDIPRPSGNEGAIREYLLNFANERGFEARVDGRGNLAFDVPASEGLEDKPRVILQGHMDIVTVPGKNDIAPTQVYIDEEGFVRAKGTTLGADNGIGVATAMALSDDNELEHGPLTVLITVHEESLPMGAQELDPNIVPVDAKFIINLDSEEGPGYICRGCAANCDIEAIFEIGEREALPPGYTVLALSLKGLPGGHSGVDIHRGRGNAIKLMNELLMKVDDFDESAPGTGMKLLKYAGGTRRNVIPSTAEALIAVPHDRLGEVMKLAQDFVAEVKSDTSAVDTEGGGLIQANIQGLKIETIELGLIFGDAAAVSDRVKDRILDAIDSLKVGPMEQVEDSFTGGVLLSNSLGILREYQAEDGSGSYFQLSSMARGAKVEELREKADELKRVLEECCASRVEVGSADGAWLEPMESRAIQTAMEVAREMGVDPVVFAYHAGLEVAYVQNRLKEKAREISGVSLGPKIVDAHSDQERVCLRSVWETYEFIRALVKRFAV